MSGEERGDRGLRTGPHGAPLSEPFVLGTMPGPLGPTSGQTPEGGDVQVISSGWRLAWREFADNRLALFSLGLLVFFVLLSFVGPIFYHGDATDVNILGAYQSPGPSHLLGTDEQGFDVLKRVMTGGQVTFEVALAATLAAIVIGTLYGAISGLFGGFFDSLLMRIVDVLLSIPMLLVVLILATTTNGTVLEMSLIIAAFSWLVPARLVRAEVLTLRERDFVQAATVMGASRARIVYRHLLPNAISVTIVNVTFLVADSILILAYLGILGFGLQFPHTSWGDMLGNAESNLQAGYWWLVWPVGFCLVAVVLAVNVIGDALRDSLDVRLRRR